MPEYWHGRPDSSEYPESSEAYVRLVPESTILPVMTEQLERTLYLLGGIDEARAGHRYAPDKWSIRELVGHLIDTERILAYRALRFARGDRTPLAGYDENDYVRASGFDRRALSELAEELRLLRQSSRMLFGSLPPETHLQKGVADGKEFTLRSLPFILVGHERHHVAVLEERYLRGEVRP